MINETLNQTIQAIQQECITKNIQVLGADIINRDLFFYLLGVASIIALFILFKMLFGGGLINTK